MRFIDRKGQPVTLPDNLEDRDALRYLKVGEEAYTVPWAVVVDEQRGMWINVAFGAHRVPGGTVSLRVKRAATGWVIWPGKSRWEVRTIDHEKCELEPVISLRGMMNPISGLFMPD